MQVNNPHVDDTLVPRVINEICNNGSDGNINRIYPTTEYGVTMTTDSADGTSYVDSGSHAASHCNSQENISSDSNIGVLRSMEPVSSFADVEPTTVAHAAADVSTDDHSSRFATSEPDSKRFRLEEPRDGSAQPAEVSKSCNSIGLEPLSTGRKQEALNEPTVNQIYLESPPGGQAEPSLAAAGIPEVTEPSESNWDDGSTVNKILPGRGSGTKLGAIPEVVAQFKRGRRSTVAIRKLHQILFLDAGNDETRIDNILEWNGLPDSDSSNILEKLNACMSSSELREIGRKILGLASGTDGKDTKAAWCAAIADILNEPTPDKFHRTGAGSGSGKTRGPSGFQLFCAIEREKLKSVNPSLNHRALMKTLGEKWRNVSGEDKQLFQAKSQALRSASEIQASNLETKPEGLSEAVIMDEVKNHDSEAPEPQQTQHESMDEGEKTKAFESNEVVTRDELKSISEVTKDSMDNILSPPERNQDQINAIETKTLTEMPPTEEDGIAAVHAPKMSPCSDSLATTAA